MRRQEFLNRQAMDAVRQMNAMLSPDVREMTFRFNDGGRKKANFKGKTGDCVCRAIAIAFKLPYKEVYDKLNELGKQEKPSMRRKGRSSARKGMHKVTYHDFICSLGATWVPTMKVGQGCTVHLREGEVPAKGRLIVRLSRHIAAVIDGVIHDISDPSRYGTRCVYGYYIVSPKGHK